MKLFFALGVKLLCPVKRNEVYKFFLRMNGSVLMPEWMTKQFLFSGDLRNRNSYKL